MKYVEVSVEVESYLGKYILNFLSKDQTQIFTIPASLHLVYRARDFATKVPVKQPVFVKMRLTDPTHDRVQATIRMLTKQFEQHLIQKTYIESKNGFLSRNAIINFLLSLNITDKEYSLVRGEKLWYRSNEYKLLRDKVVAVYVSRVEAV